MTSATDVVRARDELYEMFAADRRSHDPVLTGIKRMNAALYMAGPGDVGYQGPYDGSHDRSTLTMCMAAALLAGLTSNVPGEAAANYYVAPELHDSIVGIADALPDDTIHDDAPPPSPAGFALLGTPWRWTDPWGHEHTVEAVSWAPGALPFDTPEEGRRTLHPTFVGLWTRLPSSNYDYLRGVVEHNVEPPVSQALYEAFGRHGWLLTRVTSLFWTSEGDGFRFELGPQRFEMTADERARATASDDDLPLVGDASNYNASRLVHALFLALAGAQHTPGSTRDPVIATELPNRTRTKVARRSGSSPLVSMIYAGAQRPPTPRENIGTRGPIGCRYWREGFTKLVELPDGRRVVRKRRGSWVNKDRTDLPLSPYTKVRIAKGTIARPSDVISESEAS